MYDGITRPDSRSFENPSPLQILLNTFSRSSFSHLSPYIHDSFSIPSSHAVFVIFEFFIATLISSILISPGSSLSSFSVSPFSYVLLSSYSSVSLSCALKCSPTRLLLFLWRQVLFYSAGSSSSKTSFLFCLLLHHLSSFCLLFLYSCLSPPHTLFPLSAIVSSTSYLSHFFKRIFRSLLMVPPGIFFSVIINFVCHFCPAVCFSSLCQPTYLLLFSFS